MLYVTDRDSAFDRASGLLNANIVFFLGINCQFPPRPVLTFPFQYFLPRSLRVTQKGLDGSFILFPCCTHKSSSMSTPLNSVMSQWFLISRKIGEVVGRHEEGETLCDMQR